MKILTISLLLSCTLYSNFIFANDVYLKDISGSNYLIPNKKSAELGIGWVRDNLSWSDIEVKPGTYDWSAFDKKVLAAKAENLQMLPILAYTPAWNRSNPIKKSSPPENYDSWNKFVTAAINHYTAAPFNIHYYQLWNEPTPQAKFWLGSTSDYIDKIYIPAAKIIRASGGKVVFGGWPISNSLKEFETTLDHNNAWKYTNIIDFHYGLAKYYTELYEKYVITHKVDGIWQTELGYKAGPLLLSRTYVSVLSWATLHNWDSSDKYKVFWYPAWANGAGAQKALTMPGPNKQIIYTDNGNELKVLNEIFGTGAISAYSTITLDGSDGSITKIDSFKVGGNKIVFAPWFDNSIFDMSGKNEFVISILKQNNFKNIKIISPNGSILPYNKTDNNKFIKMAINKSDLNNICASCSKDRLIYVVVETD